MKLKHLMAISFGLSGVCFAIFAMQNFVPGKYSWGAIALAQGPGGSSPGPAGATS